MSSGRKFLVPPENDVQTRAPWVPSTPGKPILPTRSNGIPVERCGNHQPDRANWHKVVGVTNRNLQQMMNYKAVGQNFDRIGLMGQIGSSYNSGVPPAEKPSFNHNVAFRSRTFRNDNVPQNNNPLAEQLMIKNTRLMAAATPANGMLNKSFDTAHNPTILNSYSQIDSSWTEPSFTSLLLGSEYPSSGSNQWINNATFLQMPRDGLPACFRPNYDLNMPPRSEVDATLSTTNSSPFAPETPDQRKQFKDHNNLEMLNFSVDISSNHEKDKLENLLISVEKEANENGCNELVQNIVDSSSAAISTPIKEKNTSEQQVDRGIDLNKTPEQKPPKRRKHRPKVIVEGKPKRTPKPKTSRNTKSKENPSGKRKYERKKSLETKETQPTDTTNDFTVPASESGSKSCKRMLNFDSENNTKGENQGNNLQMEIRQETKAAFMSLDSQSTKLCTESKSVTGAEFAMQLKEQKGYIEKFHQSGNSSNIACSINQMPAESIPLPNRGAPAAMPAAIKYNTLNVIARSVNMRNLTQNQKSETTGNSLGHQHQGELNGNFFQANSNYQNLDQTRHMTRLSTPPMSEGNVVNSDERRGLKREYCHMIEHASPSSENWVGTPSLFQETYQVDDHSSNHCIVGNRSLETHKKRRTANGFHTEIFSTPCVFAKDVSGQAATVGRNTLNSESGASQISARNYDADKTSKKPKDAVNGASSNYHSHSITDEHNLQLTASALLSNKENTEKKRSSRSTQIHDICSSTTMSHSNLLSSTSPTAPTSGYDQIEGTFHANMSVKRYMEPTSSNTVSSNTNKVLLQKHKGARHEDQQYTIQARDLPEKQENTDTLDIITCRLQGLHITGRSKQEDKEEKNALVPYEVGDTLVPYEGFDLIKKHTRPKVDLDPETNRIWKLLMGKEASYGTEEEDNGKEKWWEEEREVFKGRAESFIARMHLVQGDRRFSQWKGSVVDSVIGVFLTQNVSDHLSSSAFMSLAARFPLQSTTTDLTCYQSGRTSRIAKEPEIQRLDPDRTVKSYENLVRQLAYNQASVTYCESPEHRTGPILGTRTRLATEYNGMAKEKGSSSQNSSGSLFLQVNGKIQSSSGSNYYSTNGGEPSKIHGPSTTLLHMGRTTSFQGLHCPVTGISCSENRSTHWHKQLEDINYLISSSTLYKPTISSVPYMQGSIMGPSHFQLQVTPDLAVQEVDTLGPLREQSIFFLPSTTSGITNEKGVDYKRRSIGHGAERISKTQHRVSIIQAPKIGQCEYLARHPTHQESSLQSEPQATQNQLSHKTHQQGMSRTFHMESILVREPVRATDTVAARQSGIAHQVPTEPKCTKQAFDIEERITAGGKKILLENKTAEANGKEQVYFSGDTTTGTSANTSNAKNGKAEDDKKQSFDWDSLRKQVQDSGRRRKRTKDSVDSLDYEAVRRADVNEISNAIKERGMNNVLAGRIKDFLNRLLREHGSIDLEWLRDIPPDKAKDYLLSIRGLGLKSVECVRLLTLHHLAFPVDTNVGRIAVRLGWVPLQPLPESLQLHLLELYPVLESIQKYLWPRLYKLDQQTLYELHYQMITFGKVFCTKSKPNCNACPMRGECRHFASAFASARLALPAPEEKNIVRSSNANDKSPAVVIKPMPLPLAGSDELIGTVSIMGYEPIIEEPTTPELDTTEVSESDIEDGIYEDSDEIPMIKLNIEEFTQNLHNYMQENTELQESDMSNALVAVNTEAASLPTPKLKNVSRLRTEHQVYELPDSHPLLEGMDKREPDDPSPYLLAIWTPGETANSVQPPERRCVSQESGKLCSEKTCFSCSSVREANSLTVRGTLLIPCRTAMRGSFPLNGTYFQVNEVFADHESSLNPINVPRTLIWNLPRRMVYFGTSVSTIFKGLSTEGIQYCFWRGFVCVRGFDRKTRAPRPLMARLHFPASKLTKTKVEDKQRGP